MMMRRAMAGLAAVLALGLAAPVAAQDDRSEIDAPWDPAETMTIIETGYDEIAGVPDNDFCKAMAWLLLQYQDGGAPATEAIDFCAQTLGGTLAGQAWIPESWLPLVFEGDEPDTTLTGQQLTEFGDGFYIVGEDIKPGTYRSRVPAECYWARYRDFNDDLIENGLADLPRIYEVKIKATDALFESSGCGTWSRVGN